MNAHEYLIDSHHRRRQRAEAKQRRLFWLLVAPLTVIVAVHVVREALK